MVSMATTTTVKAALKGLKDQGCDVTLNTKAGTAEAKDGAVVVYKALQKGRGQPWIVRTSNSDRVTWK